MRRKGQYHETNLRQCISYAPGPFLGLVLGIITGLLFNIVRRNREER